MGIWLSTAARVLAKRRMARKWAIATATTWATTIPTTWRFQINSMDARLVTTEA